MTKQKERSRSSLLTGGGGFTYEDVVVAYYLTALLREEGAQGCRGSVTRVGVQQDRQGEPMDDLVVDAMQLGESSRLSLQVKSSLTISDKDDDLKEIFKGAITTRRKPDFKVGRDRYGFITNSVAISRFNSLKRILELAEASTTGLEFSSRFESGKEASGPDIALRSELSNLITPAGSDAELDFYKHFVCYRFDNLEPDGDRFVELINRLDEITTSGGNVFAEVLCRHVRLGEGAAKVWTRNSLIADIRSVVPLRVSPSFKADVGILTSLAEEALAGIRADIAGFSIDRAEAVSNAVKAAADHVFTNISGLPGCGKSVILRRCVEQAMGRGPVLFLKSDRLDAATWRSFANSQGLRHQTASDLLSEIGAVGTPILFIDGIDRIDPRNRGVITDLLNAIQREPELQHWHILVTSRDQGLEVLRSWIPASLYAKTGLGNVPVSTLDDKEADLLADQYPALRPLLYGATAVREIARRPFFAAVLADQAANLGFEKNPPPQTEIELIEAWWRAGGYNVEAEAADVRQRALLNLAEVGAPTLGKEIRGKFIKEETAAQLKGLRQDKIVDVVVAGSSYKFKHDIFFEWAFFRLLIDEGQSWPEALVKAGEPPLLARIVSLLSQFEYEKGSSWVSTYGPLVARALRPQWRRAWLLGPAASTRFVKHLTVFESLMTSNDFALLEKFLVWFQAERTIPNPLILQSTTSEIDSSLVVRAADLLGWPSDVPQWKRVLAWIFSRHTTFPVLILPHVVELFNVWQNMCADFTNSVSEQIIAISDAWLVEIEAGTSTRWDEMKRDTRDSLASDLRKMLLRAARSYPDNAGRALDRLIDWKDRSNTVLKSVFGLSAVLAEVHPNKLAELVRVEVVEELPKDKRDRDVRERKEHYARLEAARGKTEEQRSEAEKRMISSPVLFGALGQDRYDFDDIGIDRHHNAFYPAAPAHEPFDALFKAAPDVARELVRQLSNHATIGWLQIHEINRQDFGTPLAIKIDFPWGQQSFWGNQRTYSWYFGEGGAQAIEAAWLAMTYWAHRQLDDGADLDELIHKVVEGNQSVAALGLAVSLAIERSERAPTVLALLRAQRLWALDFPRQIQEAARGANFFGFDPRDQMNSKQKAADRYLKDRKYRQQSLKDLAYLYALNSDDAGYDDFAAALARFPVDLPYGLEEQVGHAAFEEGARETAMGWAQFANKANYGWAHAPGRDGVVELIYRDPTPKTPERLEEIEENANTLRDFGVVTWASQSLSEEVVGERISLDAALSFARSRDSATLFASVSEAGTGITQACVAAVAATAIRFGATAGDLEWAWTIMDRIATISEAPESFRFSENSHDPRNFYIAALYADIQTSEPRPTSSARLLTIAADLNPKISKLAFAGLLKGQGMPFEFTWNVGVLASELFISHAPRGPHNESEDEAVRRYREAALARALERLNAPSQSPADFVGPPAPWVRTSGKHRGGVRNSLNNEYWTHPTPDFQPQFAATVVPWFPVEKWAEEPALRGKLLRYVAELVAWTAERNFPSFAAQGEDRSSNDYEWIRALAKLVARIVVHASGSDAFATFVTPMAKHKHRDVLLFVGELTDSITRRHIYDSQQISLQAVHILDELMTRMLAEPEFSPNSYRAGEIRDRHLYSMLQSFFLVSAKDYPGSARFANGDWGDLPTMMSQVERLMAVAGWAATVTNQFLTLTERVAHSMPIETFSRLVRQSMDAEGFRMERWKGADILAGVSGVIQMLADVNYPLSQESAGRLLTILDRLVDMGDRRAAALQQSEHFRSIQTSVPAATIA